MMFADKMIARSRFPVAHHGVISGRMISRRVSSRMYTAPAASAAKASVRRQRGLVKFLAVSSAIGGIGVTAYYTNDSARHTFLLLKRVGVVTVAATECFYMYGRTLQSSYENDDMRQQALTETHKKAAKITLRALETNGGIYIKLGQHVSAMTYLLPREWTDTMIPLQQRCPESSIEEIDQMFKEDLGKGIDEMFSEFETRPIGVASLAQVHIATLREGGERVAVKCQHPSLREFVPIDVFMTQKVFEMMKKVFPEYSLTWLGDELQSSIYVELDFENEAKNATNTAKYFKDFTKQTALRIPKIYNSNKRILVMEYVGGARLDDLKYMDEHNISRADVSSCLSHIFNNMIFTPGVGVHCDPHGGNLAIRHLEKKKDGHDFEIVLYDHGLYRQIPEQMRIDYAKFWLALLDGDVNKMEKYAIRFAGITHEQFPILAAAITGRDFKHALGGDVTSARGDDEVELMSDALLNRGELLGLMSLLAQLPRIVLLILKTNDLTRHLDENLQNPLGLERTFFIMATYCAKTVLTDDLRHANRLTALSRLSAQLKSYWTYITRVDQLYWYDLVMVCKRLVGDFYSFIRS